MKGSNNMWRCFLLRINNDIGADTGKEKSTDNAIEQVLSVHLKTTSH